MREIKFRQYESMYGVMIQWEGDPDGPSEAHRQGLKEAIKQYGFDELAKASIFMQYTGLKDKNGKEIYEKDRFQHGRNVGTIEYIEDSFKIVWDEPNIEFYNEILRFHAEDGEVIGSSFKLKEDT